MSTIGGKKISLPMVVLAACVMGIALGLFGFNIWHTSRCSTGGEHEDMEEYIAAFNRRLLESESQVLRNEILMNKVLATMQSELLKVEDREYKELSSKSTDEAIRISLYLASHPAPPMPVFNLESQYMDAETLADAIDDVFATSGDPEFEFMKEYGSEFKEEFEEFNPLTDAEATKVCTELKEKYNVIIGVSWGDLPYDLQQTWVMNSCDFHLGENAIEESTRVEGGETGGNGESSTFEGFEGLSD